MIYWLLTRRYKASLSFVASSLLLAAGSTLAVGPALMLAYLRELSEVSNVLLVSFNNQSLAAWWMAPRHPAAELWEWRIFPLPSFVKAVSTLFCILASITGGLLDRKFAARNLPSPPCGAALAMVGATIFTPIAWTHYYIVLIIPMMLLLDALVISTTAIRGPSKAFFPGHSHRVRATAISFAMLAAIYVLNLYPLAFRAVTHGFKAYSLIRSQFYSGIVCLAAMAMLSISSSSVRSTTQATWPGTRN